MLGHGWKPDGYLFLRWCGGCSWEIVSLVILCCLILHWVQCWEVAKGSSRLETLVLKVCGWGVYPGVGNWMSRCIFLGK